MNEKKLISKDDVQHVANLARLALSESEKTQFTEELNAILGYVKEIEEVKVDNYERFDHYNLKENQFRKDEIEEVSNEDKNAILNLFPKKEGNSLKVKETLNGGD
jgi:aspartyl-tRNA(Asn)/glutamyl-tRNA(Gln) amidotransferase subunit C